jgi:hypothetical protein
MADGDRSDIAPDHAGTSGSAHEAEFRPTGGHELDVPQPRPPAPSSRQPVGPEVITPYEVVGRPIPRLTARQRFLLWWTRPITILLVAATVVVLLVATAALTTLAITAGPSADPTASPSESPSASPSPSATPAPGSPAPSDSEEPAASPGLTDSPAPDSSSSDVNLPIPPVDAVGEPFQGGTYQKSDPSGRLGLDVDDAREQNQDLFDTDIAVTPYGIVGRNGVVLAPYTQAGRPKLGSCAAIPRDQWALDVPVEELKPGATFCFTTTEARYGYLTVQDAVRNNAGQLADITFNYLVWEGPND